MKIMMISSDQELIQSAKSTLSSNQDLDILTNLSDPLEVTSRVCEETPLALIVDDDLLKPNTAKILRSIRKLRENVHIVFMTSDTSIELGREVSPIGIHFYGIKPIGETMILNVMESLNKLDTKTLSN